MPAYAERSRAIARPALTTVCRILNDSGAEYRVIGGCAVLMVLEDSAGGRANDYVGTLDVDIENEALREAVHLAQRFVEELDRLLGT